MHVNIVQEVALKKISKRPNFWGLFLSFSKVVFVYRRETSKRAFPPAVGK